MKRLVLDLLNRWRRSSPEVASSEAEVIPLHSDSSTEPVVESSAPQIETPAIDASASDISAIVSEESFEAGAFKPYSFGNPEANTPATPIAPPLAHYPRSLINHEAEMLITLRELKDVFEGTEWSKLMRNARDGGATSIMACTVLDKTMALLHHGYQHVEMMLDAAQNVRATTTQLASIADDIKAVSNQTRIVSINAGIEANRAGIHGRTFQVVAQQMTALSDDTRNLTASIDTKLAGVNEKISINRELCGKVGKLFGDVNQELGEFKKMMMRVEELSGIQVDQLVQIEHMLTTQKPKKDEAA